MTNVTNNNYIKVKNFLTEKMYLNENISEEIQKAKAAFRKLVKQKLAAFVFTEQKIKEAGKYRQEGKDYVVQDGDVLFFKFNVTK